MFVTDPVPPGPVRIIQLNNVTKAVTPKSYQTGREYLASEFMEQVRTALVDAAGNVYIVNDKNARKHSKYFEAQLHKRLGVEPGELLRIKGNGDGWDIIDTGDTGK